jgi:hypothetical protein
MGSTVALAHHVEYHPRGQNDIGRICIYSGDPGVERAVEWFIAVTSLVIGASHIVRAGDWVATFGILHRAGRPGAFVNGALSLVPGALIVASHRSWSWPGTILTAFGWLLVLKGLICFLAPDMALHSMERAPSRRAFVAGGIALIAVGTWAVYCLAFGGLTS